METKIREHIDIYRIFTSEIEFAIAQLKKILEWLWLARDMKILSDFTFGDLYDYAIDAIVELEKLLPNRELLNQLGKWSE